MDISTAVAGNLAAGEVQTSLHPSPTGQPAEVHLVEIRECLREMCNHLLHQVDFEPDIYSTKNLNNVAPWITEYKYLDKEYRTLHVLVGAACTLQVSVGGVATFNVTFATAPTAGQFTVGQPLRWRYPQGTTALLSAPTLTGGAFFPIVILYSNETGI